MSAQCLAFKFAVRTGILKIGKVKIGTVQTATVTTENQYLMIILLYDKIYIKLNKKTFFPSPTHRPPPLFVYIERKNVTHTLWSESVSNEHPLFDSAILSNGHDALFIVGLDRPLDAPHWTDVSSNCTTVTQPHVLDVLHYIRYIEYPQPD